MNYKTTSRQYRSEHNGIFKSFVILLVCFLSMTLCSQTPKSDSDSQNDKLIKDYFNSKGYTALIVFDSSNIKQFWTNKTVYSSKGVINIVLSNKKEQFEDELQRIQLMNVFETQDCRIDVVAETPNLSFSVYSSDKKTVIAESKYKEDFVQYHVFSSVFHLEDTSDFSFYLRFSADEPVQSISIKQIVLSFSNNANSHFPGSPGFNALLEEIDNNGIASTKGDIKYIVKRDLGKVYIKVPNESLDTYRFFYAIYPLDKKDLPPERLQIGYINKDFSTKEKYIKIPCQPNSDIKYSIIQQTLPTFECSAILIGQFDSNQRFWEVDLAKTK